MLARARRIRLEPRPGHVLPRRLRRPRQGARRLHRTSHARPRLRPETKSRVEVKKSRVDVADVVVIGGGLIGCALGRELARRGAHTVIVERGELGAEASRAAAGMVAPQAETERPGPLLDL